MDGICYDSTLWILIQAPVSLAKINTHRLFLLSWCSAWKLQCTWQRTWYVHVNPTFLFSSISYFRSNLLCSVLTASNASLPAARDPQLRSFEDIGHTSAWRTVAGMGKITDLVWSKSSRWYKVRWSRLSNPMNIRPCATSIGVRKQSIHDMAPWNLYNIFHELSGCHCELHHMMQHGPSGFKSVWISTFFCNFRKKSDFQITDKLRKTT